MNQQGFQLIDNYKEDALVAVGVEGSKTGADLRQAVCAVALALPEATPGRQVLILCEDRYDFAVAIWAAWQRRYAVALPPNTKPETLESLMRTEDFAAVLHHGDGPGIDVRQLAHESTRIELALRIVEPSERIATLYTSGSTGDAQVCQKKARQLLGEPRVLASNFNVASDHRVLATVPARHIYGILFGVLLPMTAGACFVRDTPFHAEAVADCIRRFHVDTLVSVPVHLRGLLNLEPRSVALGRVFSSGAAMPHAATVALNQRFGFRITEIFGSSETGGIAFRDSLSQEPWNPLPTVEIAVDSQNRLLVSSPFADSDHGVPILCADRVEVLEDGRFHHIGREDGVVKIGGVRVSEKEVERKILALPGVADAVVKSVRVDRPREHEIWAALVAPEWNPKRLRQALLQWFEPVALPRRVRFVSALPRQATGKIHRADFLALFESQEGRDPKEKRNLSFPVRSHVPRNEADVECHDFEIEVPSDLYYFQGHFEGKPILPGVVQVNELVLERCEAVWSDLGPLQRIARLKFQRTIGPGEVLRLELRRKQGTRELRFRIASGDNPCASGSFLFAAPKPA
jgi:acyl-coenzyme A synthetase/AMP-(fatty) acid ligase/3-hydroxymyristoyl/3-hydroxydecanoyl-(acyl carrier protein) dehydratase